ncbi:unnamed protein product [Colletotrichum noveboracense]|uniref:Protein kinase domain-containing protein n=1 Tax=Colletotrichum noveboracense TaxID=2664923 RepID=A0A9W4RM25_9PEZI|nr:unnamed protein product [Colletotrichum noveboracense]
MQCCAGITEFKQYVSHYIESNRCYGRNSYNDRVPFVPRIVLDEFWTMERIENVLRSPTERIQAISHTIKSRYVAVFSILVFMSQPEHIPIFIQGGIEDSKLPLDTTPYAYSETSESLHVFDEFQKEQWKFCPLEFDAGDKLSNRHISPYHIVPVLEKTRINSRGAADEDDVSIYKVKLHPRCFHQTVVVFKVFSGDDPETAKMYLNEVDMYSQLVRESAFDHIIRYYGSFETAGLRTIVLEHANGGSLKSFFLNNPPPHDQSNRKQFWNSLMGLLRGLENIHNLNETKGYSKGAWVLRGTHQDIKPQNILLCNTSFENMYDIKFKFVDMGTGNIRKMKNQGLDRDALDQAGNGMYSGPEACQDDGEARGIRGNSDIWSFGGIASEALVWCIWGEYGRSQYQTERFQATRETILKGGFHEGAFHDGDCLLDVVAERHRRTIAATGESEPWWSRLSDLILTRMLVPEPRDRATATELLHEWFGTPKLVSHYSDPIQPSTRPGTISSEQDYNPRLSRRSRSTQIFLVDDSVSMIKHQTAIARACRVLCYILKIGNVDPDFFELHFTSGKDPVISTTSSRLQEVIEEMSFTDTACDMSLGLEPIASNVIDRSKPASIYVFTNGHWNTQEDEKFCFVDSEIGRLVNHRRKRGKPRNWVGVQFIRFFEHPETESDELGRLRLEALDDELKVNINDDIVDTTNYDGDIYKMLLGAISPVVDRA